jgi:hypothetical protein
MIDPDRLLRASFPDEFLQDTLRCVFNAYVMARAHCHSQYAYPEAHDLYPHERRAIFERTWRKISGGYPSVTAEPKDNKSKSAFHTEIRSNEIVLTANVVDKPSQIVRYANFRETLAENGQLTLDLDVFKDDDADRSKVYAILIHGPSQAISPAFANIVFPDRNCKSYLEPKIDLFKEYPDILNAFKTPEEEVEPTPIQIKRNIPREEPFGEQA